LAVLKYLDPFYAKLNKQNLFIINIIIVIITSVVFLLLLLVLLYYFVSHICI